MGHNFELRGARKIPTDGIDKWLVTGRGSLSRSFERWAKISNRKVELNVGKFKKKKETHHGYCIHDIDGINSVPISRSMMSFIFAPILSFSPTCIVHTFLSAAAVKRMIHRKDGEDASPAIIEYPSSVVKCHFSRVYSM
jgi:hypothetical protein